MEKKLLLAVTLSILVMLVYPFIISKISPPQTRQDFLTQPLEKQEVVKDYQTNVVNEKLSDITMPLDMNSFFIDDRKYAIEIADLGGSIYSIKIKDDKRPDIDLVRDAVYESGILAIEGEGVLKGLSSQVFSIKEDTNSFYAEKNGLAIEKNIIFLKGKYGLMASVKIKNNSGSTQNLSFEITTASRISSKELYESRYIGADVLYKDGKFKRIASGNFNKYNRLYNEDIDWLALRNKYYSIIAKPEFSTKGVFTKKVKDAPCAGFIVDERILPGETKFYDFLMYIGPTDIDELEKISPSFGKALNFGFFTSISLILLSVLKFFYGLFHNYGVAILLLTCCISVLLYPLTFKSMSSMKRMQEFQPEIEKVRQQYKDNPQKLNKEIMELYRRHKINPMSGCFPMLLQMPIFLSLYQTLMRSVELKGASFLWIKDLSMPDAAFTLPVSLPILGSTINILPILMIGAMILQQKMTHAKNVASVSEQQKMMTMIMPVVFGFIFYGLPSGLVLYWLTNTIFTTSLQSFFLRKS